MSGWLSTCVSRALAQPVPLQTLEAALGDLAEEYALRAHGRSPLRASVWYWAQLARSMPQMMWLDVRRQGAGTTCAVAFAAWLVASVVEFIADAMLIAWSGSDAPVRELPGVLVGLAAFASGGYLASVVRPAATKVLAAMIALIVVGLMIAGPQNVPLWYGPVFLVFGPLVSIAGGAWRRTPL